eukprot:2081184-Pleurochrysis_carterae.AAC.3
MASLYASNLFSPAHAPPFMFTLARIGDCVVSRTRLRAYASTWDWHTCVDRLIAISDALC